MSLFAQKWNSVCIWCDVPFWRSQLHLPKMVYAATIICLRFGIMHTLKHVYFICVLRPSMCTCRECVKCATCVCMLFIRSNESDESLLLCVPFTFLSSTLFVFHIFAEMWTTFLETLSRLLPPPSVWEIWQFSWLWRDSLVKIWLTLRLVCFATHNCYLCGMRLKFFFG